MLEKDADKAEILQNLLKSVAQRITLEIFQKRKAEVEWDLSVLYNDAVNDRNICRNEASFVGIFFKHPHEDRNMLVHCQLQKKQN